MKLIEDPAAIRRMRKLKAVNGCTVKELRQGGGDRSTMCRIGLLLTSAAKSAGPNTRKPNYEEVALRRARLHKLAHGQVKNLERQLRSLKSPPRWKLRRGAQLAARVCAQVADFEEEASLASAGQTKLRSLSSRGVDGVSLDKLRCACLTAVQKISARLPVKDKVRVDIQRSRGRYQCGGASFAVARSTKFVLPSAGLSKRQVKARKAAVSSLAKASPKRMAGLKRMLARHAGEIDACAKRSRRGSRTRSIRARKMQQCICPKAKAWRFSTGPSVAFEEDGKPGQLVVRLALNPRGGVDTCEVVPKK